MLGDVYINKIHARQCLYIISLYCREGLNGGVGKIGGAVLKKGQYCLFSY